MIHVFWVRKSVTFFYSLLKLNTYLECQYYLFLIYFPLFFLYKLHPSLQQACLCLFLSLHTNIWKREEKGEILTLASSALSRLSYIPGLCRLRNWSSPWCRIPFQVYWRVISTFSTWAFVTKGEWSICKSFNGAIPTELFIYFLFLFYFILFFLDLARLFFLWKVFMAALYSVLF